VSPQSAHSRALSTLCTPTTRQRAPALLKFWPSPEGAPSKFLQVPRARPPVSHSRAARPLCESKSRGLSRQGLTHGGRPPSPSRNLAKSRGRAPLDQGSALVCQWVNSTGRPAARTKNIAPSGAPSSKPGARPRDTLKIWLSPEGARPSSNLAKYRGRTLGRSPRSRARPRRPVCGSRGPSSYPREKVGALGSAAL